MKQDTEFTPVVFRRSRRKEPEGRGAEITAVFPTVPGDYHGYEMVCYAHMGQHGACNFGWYNTTHKATLTEYADLFKELESIGYRLKVYQKITPQLREELRKNAAKLA